MKQGQNAALLSLITVEIDGITDAIPEMYAASLVLPELAFALYFIYTVAGVIFFIPLVPVTSKSRLNSSFPSQMSHRVSLYRNWSLLGHQDLSSYEDMESKHPNQSCPDRGRPWTHHRY